MRGISILLLLVALTPYVFAHTYFSSITIDGQALAEGDCMRPHPPQAKENPIPLVTAPDMTCGWLPYASEAANRKCPVNAGAKLGLQWYHTSPDPSDDIVATTHLGPCIVYMAKSDTGSGPVWFKIYEDGYDSSTSKWCVDKLIANRGLFTVTIPSDIAPGNYLLRGEILALHGAYVADGVQPYVGCAELTISGSGSANPSGVSLPGYYKNTDPGMLFDIYGSFTSYPIPGPAVYKAGSAAPTPAAGATTKPVTAAPSTSAPSTSAPSTSAPSTDAPSTSAPSTSAPSTSAPSTSAPSTSAPSTSAPSTSAPTTQKPSASPTSVAPTTSGNVRIQLFPSSSDWWLAVAVRAQKDVSGVELKDSSSIKDWEPLAATNWGYWAFPTNKQMVLPISLRITASDGDQLEIPNAFTSWTLTTFQDTGLNFGGSGKATSAPTDSPTTAPTGSPTTAPTGSPTTAPTDSTAAPTDLTESPTASQNPTQTAAPAPIDTSNHTNSIKMHIHKGSTVWWMAVQLVNEVQVTSAIEIRDAVNGKWDSFDTTTWGYWSYSTKGTALTVPLTFRLTATNGKSVSFVIDDIYPDTTIETAQQYV